MFFKEILTVMAMIASGLTAHQDAAMDLQVAAPEIGGPAMAQVSDARNPISVVVRGPEDARRVSGDFKNVGLQEIMNWLQGEDVSFVVGDDVKSDRRVTLHIANQPLNSTIDAVLEALGLHAERRGDVIVVKSGAGFPFGFHSMTPMPKVPPMKAMPQIKIEEFTKSLKGLDEIPQMMELHGLGTKEFDGEKFAQEFKKHFDEKKFAEQFQKEFDAQKFAEQFQKIFDEKAFEKQFKTFNDPRFIEKIQRQGELDARQAELRGRLAEKLARDIKVRVGKQDWLDTDQLIKSLTAAQKSIQAKRGYLTPSDLTTSQRALLHGMDKGHFSINITTNSGKLILKNK